MKIQEEINFLKEFGFIYNIKHTEWVSPLVVVPKKNGKLPMFVNLKKVNVAMIKDHKSFSLMSLQSELRTSCII